MGFDVVHLNLHKTFSTPHGGGGPGAGPVCVKAHLAPFLPGPVVQTASDSSLPPDSQRGPEFTLAAPEQSIGKTMAFHGNFGVLVRALTYIKSLGADGLRAISENAVINANYIQRRLGDSYNLPYDRNCMHEVVFAGVRRAQGVLIEGSRVKTLDIAKRLIDYGFHPPTIYFPLIVDEALMIEPTEAEGKDNLDGFCDAMLEIAREAQESPDLLRGAPYTAPIRRLDEATAARKPVLRWQPQ
jgi:glycine dehydrogenase subunit 2